MYIYILIYIIYKTWFNSYFYFLVFQLKLDYIRKHDLSHKSMLK